jgi:hypothetical protein
MQKYDLCEYIPIIKICICMQNNILYSDSFFYESLTYLSLVVMHTFIKNMFLHRNPHPNHHSRRILYYDTILHSFFTRWFGRAISVITK